MSSQTKKERNAVNAVRDFVDAADCLRSYLEENDKTPLWDGSIFVYDGEPDKNPNLVGTLRSQIKGTEVDAFQDKEHYRLTFDELNILMSEGGLYFFVVELLKDDYNQRKIFYRELTPHTIQALVKQARQNNRGKESNSVEFTLLPLPTVTRVVEDEMVNFIRDARKQTSFVGKPSLSLEEALKGNYPLKMETSFRFQKDTPLELQLIDHPLVLYQETPYASIPVSDIEVTARATAHVDEPVKVGDVTFFTGYTRRYEQKYKVINIGDCFFLIGHRKGYENTIQSRAEIKYPRTGSIAEALHKMEFLMALMNEMELTLGENEAPIDFGGEKERITEEVSYTYAIYRDIDATWKQLQIPGTFSFDDFDEKGLNDFLNIVLHVYRKEPGVPTNPLTGEKTYYSRINAGPLNVVIRFTHLQGNLYSSDDAFTEPYYSENGVLYPMLTVAMAKSPDVFFDNVHYEEQLECYKQCLKEQHGFESVIKHDIDALRCYLDQAMKPEKREKIEWLMLELGKMS